MKPGELRRILDDILAVDFGKHGRNAIRHLEAEQTHGTNIADGYSRGVGFGGGGSSTGSSTSSVETAVLAREAASLRKHGDPFHTGTAEMCREFETIRIAARRIQAIDFDLTKQQADIPGASNTCPILGGIAEHRAAGTWVSRPVWDFHNHYGRLPTPAEKTNYERSNRWAVKA